ncbi:major royal jelly protein 3 isoform X2 [Mycetomoellerius zeteki]|uniref:major royal jelly protein 3 isoform X2 n=1 Tax=Mycetomoellerius zeteki TaxID=64791 RepID=UPI00084E82A2|nr:PREDICTED: major royal jelly protein 3-like isoform X2 [Trachymyrmex zeteki]
MEHSLFIILILSMVIISFGIEVNVVHEWKYCEYEWDSQEQKENAINSGAFDPYTCCFFDAAKSNDGRIFITMSKFFGPNVPATLVTVTNMIGPGGPLLRPYPDWSWHNRSCMCDGIVNVIRVHIQCNYIFVLDIGTIVTDQVCNPKLLIFNLKDDTLVKTIYIPIDIATNKTGSGLLIMPLVYIPNGKCTQFLDEMIVFMADSEGYGLVVYNSFTKSMCRIESDYMKPTDTSFSIAGKNFTYVGGIFSMTIIDDDLYFAAVSGNKIYKIKIKYLLKCPNEKEANKQTRLVKKLSSQTIDLTSAGQSIFYSDFRAMSILRTNVHTICNLNKTEILAQDSEKFQSVSSMKISSNECQLKCISDRFQHYPTFNTNEINFRYFKIDLC